MLLAVFVVIIGLYYISFRETAATWAAELDKKIVHNKIGEKTYRIGFTVVGTSCITFGLLTALLIA